MSFFYLFVAGFMEILGVLVMKYFTQSGRKALLLLLMLLFALSFIFLSLAMQELSMSTAYAIWTGIGAAGGVILGIVFFKEDKSPAKLLFLALIIACTISLKLVD